MKKHIWQQNYQRLCKELKQARLKANLTQTQLAEILEKPQSYVSKYETGERNLDFIETVSVCRAVELNINELIGNVINSQ